MTIFDKYFTLWDAALFDESALHDLTSLFAEDAVVKSPQGEVHAAVGMDIIELDESGKIKFLEIIPEQNITKRI